MNQSSQTTLRALCQHNDWANEQLRQFAGPLNEELLDQPFEMGPGSLRKTIAHLADTELIWLHRWRGESAPRAGREPASAQELHRRCHATAEQRNAFLDLAGPAGESSRISYTTSRGKPYTHPLGDLMLHVCNHGVHHRAQAINMLRRLGVKASNLDYIFFARRDEESQPDIEFDGDTILECLRYSDWATGRLLDAADCLDARALNRVFEMGMGSLRKTLCHIHNAEQYWLANWRGEPRSFRRFRDDLDLSELRSTSLGTAEARNEFLRGLDSGGFDDPVLVEPAPERRLCFRIGDTALQLCGHGTHHRAQALNMLRHLGGETPELDYVAWLRETG